MASLLLFLLLSAAPAKADNLAQVQQNPPEWNPKFGRNNQGSTPVKHVAPASPKKSSARGKLLQKTNGGSPHATAKPKTVLEPVSEPALKATAVHSESLPALPPGYQVGASVYDRQFLAQPNWRKKMERQQFQIPDWLAGTWQRAMSTEKSRIELPSGKKLKAAGQTEARSTDRFGTYRDKSGQIWQVFDPSRATGEVDRGTVMDCHAVTDYNLEPVDNRTIAIEVQAYHLVVSKDGRRIVHSYQDEEMNTYSLVVDGVVKTDSSVKVFDSLGKPRLLTRSVSQIRRIKPFTQ
ncbi:MAG: hypothetical protein K2Z81_00965 [Cyanobacteria bacterium]|nr:hypothetical protein [Cyanobacteriota bacterium]